jgi:hypothetical protein
MKNDVPRILEATFNSERVIPKVESRVSSKFWRRYKSG